MNYIVYTNYFIGRQRRLLNTRQITHRHTHTDTRLCVSEWSMIYGHIQSLQSSAWRRGSSLNLALIAAVAASATMWQEGATAVL